MLEALTTLSSVGIVSNMSATALVCRRVVVAPDAFVEVAIWRVAQSVRPSVHAFKYRLAELE